MGCGNVKEKLENEILKVKMDRNVVQYERKKQFQLLKEIYGCEHEIPNIPDYIDTTPIGNHIKNKKNSIPVPSSKHRKKKKLRPKRSSSFKLKKNSLISKADTIDETKQRNNIKRNNTKKITIKM